MRPRPSRSRLVLPWLVHGTAPAIAAHRRHRPRQEMIEEILGLHSITDPHGCLSAREHLWGDHDAAVVTWSDRVAVHPRVESRSSARKQPAASSSPTKALSASWSCPLAWHGSASPGLARSRHAHQPLRHQRARRAGPLLLLHTSRIAAPPGARGASASRSCCAARRSGAHPLARRRGLGVVGNGRCASRSTWLIASWRYSRSWDPAPRHSRSSVMPFANTVRSGTRCASATMSKFSWPA